MDGETGELVVSQTLDYESSAEYSFTVNVTDNGNGPRMNSSVVGNIEIVCAVLLVYTVVCLCPR